MYYGLPIQYDGVCDVQQNFELYFDLLVNKCCNLFKFENLPDTIDEKFLTTQLILNGQIGFFKDGDKLYALNGHCGGEPNVYYRPTHFIVANPILGSKDLIVEQRDGAQGTEGLDGVVVYLTQSDRQSDRQRFGGLYRLIYQTAGLLADNISSMNASQINGRVSQLWTVDNDAEAFTVEEILRDIYNGKPYRVLTQNLIEKVGVLPAAQTGQTNTLINLIEAHQYILASFYNEIGIPSNWNMKRERVNTAETELMTGSLDVSIYSMEKSLKEGIERVNELFGTSISVRFNEEIKEDEASPEEELSSNGEDTIQVQAEETSPQEDEEVEKVEVKETVEKEGEQ